MPRFKLLEGGHAEESVKGDSSSLKVYKRGDIIESHSDLCRLNSIGSHKFERIEDEAKKVDYTKVPSSPGVPAAQAATSPILHPPPTPPVIKPVPGFDAQSTLSSMSYDELKKYAEGEEINLKGAKSKDEALKIIKAAQGV